MKNNKTFTLTPAEIAADLAKARRQLANMLNVLNDDREPGLYFADQFSIIHGFYAIANKFSTAKRADLMDVVFSAVKNYDEFSRQPLDTNARQAIIAALTPILTV